MPKPYQRIACYRIKIMEISHIGIPLYPTFFFPLRIRREPPFQYTSHTGTPSVLTVKELAFNGRIATPSWVHGMQLFISSKQNPFSHNYTYLNNTKKVGERLYRLKDTLPRPSIYLNYFSNSSFRKASSSSSSPFNSSSLSNNVSSSSTSINSATVSLSSSTRTNEYGLSKDSFSKYL